MYHFSHEPAIASFVPRVPPSDSAGLATPVVWAVDAAHAYNYLLPRDCPRVTFAANLASDASDVTALIGPGAARAVVVIESGWWAQLNAATLYRYRFDPTPFTPMDPHAGYYIATSTVVPIEVAPIGDLVAALLGERVELRITPSLWPLHDVVARSTLTFSMIRMRNARPPEATAAHQ